MTQREFDSYLRLLGGLLKLAPKQREQIAGELRDHMEDRLEALLAAGVPREEAIGQALEEFGDVAALAASFREIAWNRRRKRIMRYTAASVVGVLAIILAATAFWPGDPAGRGILANARAQDEGIDEAPAMQSTNDRNAATRVALSRRANCDLSNAPLTIAMQFIAETFDVQIFLDQDQLELVGIDPETMSLSLNLKDIRGDMMLDLLLPQMDGGYYVRDGIVVVTTKEVADMQLILRVYDCADLIARDPVYSRSATAPVSLDGGAPGTNEQSPQVAKSSDLNLVALIQQSTALRGNNGWLDVGSGSGTIYRYNNKLVINQTDEVHREIEYLLEGLRADGRSDSGR